MTTITMTAKAARAVLAPALPAASTDTAYPALAAVKLTQSGGTVEAVTTNRYVAVVASVSSGMVATEDASVLIPAPLVKASLALLRKAFDSSTVMVTDDAGTVTVDTINGSVRDATITGEPPNVHRLIESVAQAGKVADGVPVSRISGTVLATIAAVVKASGKQSALSLQSTGGTHRNPLVFVVSGGDADVHGLLVPYKSDVNPAEEIVGKALVSA